MDCPLTVWRDYLDRQSLGLAQVDAILGNLPQGTPTELDLARVTELTVLTALSQPDCDLPAELEREASVVHGHMLNTQGQLDLQRLVMAQQLDQLRPRALTQDQGPIFLDTSG
ncbi:hypothetical protein V5R04_02570 [Jonesiaceae bacterium BS-20]|uniref:Uncharacterized protein n=1 Tax=Jonesiaceae bacterium BS-20 TaxID=3120821 RepID=A0AAU7DYK1_9MICO